MTVASQEQPLRVLFVCTGNICRSPMAAAILLMHARERGLSLGIASCGLLKSGRPATEYGVDVMADWGVDMANKVSRQIDVTIVRGSDLILAMSTQHARRAVGEDPDGRHKVFLLREFVHIAQQLSPPLPGQTARDRILQANGLRTVRYTEDVPSLEVDDPIGQPRPAYEAMRADLSGYITVLLDRVLLPG